MQLSYLLKLSHPPPSTTSVFRLALSSLDWKTLSTRLLSKVQPFNTRFARGRVTFRSSFSRRYKRLMEMLNPRWFQIKFFISIWQSLKCIQRSKTDVYRYIYSPRGNKKSYSSVDQLIDCSGLSVSESAWQFLSSRAKPERTNKRTLHFWKLSASQESETHVNRTYLCGCGSVFQDSWLGCVKAAELYFC